MAAKPADQLATYNAKRDFTRTQEPAGRVAKQTEGWRFLVQKHDATRLHYDFRLELDGVLKSWAVTRGPSSDPADKRLAVRTEDHPLSYATFEGIIPKGEYGGGTVMLWDEGTWEPVPGKDPRKTLAEGHLHFTLHGQRMKGAWLLIRLKPRAGEKRENWLLRKIDDADAHVPDDLTGHYLTSITTGRTMSDIAEAKRAEAKRADTKKAGAKKPAPARRRKAAPTLPAFRPVELATLVDQPPAGKDWLHEIKYDGYRIAIAVAGGVARVHTRSGLDWTDRFPAIVAAAEKLPVESALIDGEAVALDSEGRSRFQLLQHALGDGGDPQAILCYAFDLLELDGADLTDMKLTERKEKLAALLGAGDGALRYSDHVVGRGEHMFGEACRMQLEGIVSKRADSRYIGKRTRAWLKVKCIARQEFLIVGWLPSSARGRAFQSLLLGTRQADGSLVYAGKVGTGFDAALLESIGAKLAGLATQKPAVDAPKAAVRNAHWVKPELVAEIAYAEITGDGVLRHASFIGLREDKPAKDVHRETAADLPAISSRDRVLFPEAKVTKGDLADFYLRFSDPILATASRRFLSLVRCPQGRARQCFFQRHDNGGFADSVKTAPVRLKDGKTEDYLYVEDAAGLLACVQMGTIEFHGWGSRVDDMERPDRLVFDLDPDEGLPFERVRSAAEMLRDQLAAVGLEAFPMLTGGKGVHVIAPLTPEAGWDAVKDFARRFAAAMAQAHPERFTAELRKVKREGRIFIDHLRNQRSATAVMPWTVRSRPGAPVAAPVSWEELRKVEGAARWTIADGDELWERVGKMQYWGKADQTLPDV